jgi:hypothetical protein
MHACVLSLCNLALGRGCAVAAFRFVVQVLLPHPSCRPGWPSLSQLPHTPRSTFAPLHLQANLFSRLVRIIKANLDNFTSSFEDPEVQPQTSPPLLTTMALRLHPSSPWMLQSIAQ